MVRIHPDPPEFAGAVAQLGEHLLCKQGVVGSIPSSSTNREPGYWPRCGPGVVWHRIQKQAALMSDRAVCFWFTEPVLSVVL